MATATPNGARTKVVVPSIDGFRGLAVLWIVVGHCWFDLGQRIRFDSGPFLYLLRSFQFGVDVLFLVSGFVLFLPVVTGTGSIGDKRSYALRRIARIVPAFYFFLVVSYIAAAFVGNPRGGPMLWVTHALFLQTEANTFSDIGFGINRALWTMSVEVLFYAMLPLVASRYARRPFLGLGIAVAIAELWKYATTNLHWIISTLGIHWNGVSEAQLRMAKAFPSFLPQFAVGMTAAWLYNYLRTDRRPRMTSVANAGAIAGLMGFLAIAYIRGLQSANGTAGDLDIWLKTLDRTFFLGVLVVGTALATKRVQWIVSNNFSRLLGTVCYGVFLSHQPLIHFFIIRLGMNRETTRPLDFLVLAALVVPLSLCIGVLSHIYLEMPFQRWARRHVHRPTAIVTKPLAVSPDAADAPLSRS